MARRTPLFNLSIFQGEQLRASTSIASLALGGNERLCSWMASPKNKLDDCERPSCASMKALFQESMGRSSAKESSPQNPVACPVGREELGRATWALLHTTAAWFPDNPNKEDQVHAKSLISSLAALYPCTHCAEDFRSSTKSSPVEVGSRTEFALWLCSQHNLVNKKIGKPVFECSIETLDERWRTGHTSCQETQGKTKALESAGESLGQ